jgi:glycosyltransferase involved in cell wall biosynthesis
MSRVSAIVPTYENVDELRRCIASLQAQGSQLAQVIVCVDGSTDGTIEYLTTKPEQGPVPICVRTHPGNAHRGRAATRNLALDLLHDEFVWYVDSDMVLAPDALEAHLSLVERRACNSQGQVVYANADDSPWAAYLSTRAHHRGLDGAAIPFKWFSAANALVHAAHVKQMRGFDATLVAYGAEDLDFAYRLERVSGLPLINNRRSIATTVESKSIRSALAQFEEYGAVNLPLVESLHPDMPRMFMLERRASGRLWDRLFEAALDARVERIVDRVLTNAPRGLRNHLLDYKVIASVWRGYGTRAAG